MWHVAARALFGDESISLRHVAKLQTIVSTSYMPNKDLAEFFQGKMPSLGPYMCEQFVQCIRHFNYLEVNKKFTKDTPFSSPIQLLVQTALLTEDRDIASYPEYVRSLKGCMKVRTVTL